MNLDRVVPTIIVPAMQLLPTIMGGRAATAMLLAIGLQESRFEHRRQLIDGSGAPGPARGYWQFERGGGVRGVLEHQQTKLRVRATLAAMDYSTELDSYGCHEAIEHNDILACAFARLLLWTVPGAECKPGEPDRAWQQYIAGWRPGKPRRTSWDAFYARAWDMAR